jgi:hypothetical protein
MPCLRSGVSMLELIMVAAAVLTVIVLLPPAIKQVKTGVSKHKNNKMINGAVSRSKNLLSSLREKMKRKQE